MIKTYDIQALRNLLRARQADREAAIAKVNHLDREIVRLEAACYTVEACYSAEEILRLTKGRCDIRR